MKYTDNKGSASFLMLLLTMVIITVSISFNWLVREYVKTAETFQEKAQAILLAHSTYDTLIYLMLNGYFTPNSIVLPQIQGLPEIKSLPLNGQSVHISKDISVKLQDSNGLLSITSINTEALKRLLMYFGDDSQQASIAIDSLLDWINPNGLTSLNGAGKFWYSSHGFEYGPRNYQIQYKKELKLIRGFDKIYSKIEPYITILPSTGFNPNTAPDAVLASYLNIDNETLKNLKNYIQEKPITSDSELFLITGRKIVTNEAVYFFPSSFIRMTVEIGEPKPLYTIDAGISLRQTVYFPYSIIYWKEE